MKEFDFSSSRTTSTAADAQRSNLLQRDGIDAILGTIFADTTSGGFKPQFGGGSGGFQPLYDGGVKVYGSYAIDGVKVDGGGGGKTYASGVRV